VVGLPGDTIEVKENTLYVNGQEASRTFVENFNFIDDFCRDHDSLRFREDLEGVSHAVLTNTRGGSALADFGPVTVPPEHFFMMGDNRDSSSDSRVWGFVPREYMRGRALFTWLSLDGCADGGLPVIGKLRTDRIGMALE